MKVYAKNPAEIGELILDNPSPKKKIKKDPRRVAAGKKSWEKRQQNKKTKKPTRMNTEKLAKTGKAMVMKAFLLTAGTFTAVRGTKYLVDKFGQNLPEAVRRYGLIGAPMVAGVVIATKAKQKNILAQSVASGMVLSSVNGLISEFLPNSFTGDQGLSDTLGYNNSGMLADARYYVTEEGLVLDLQGTPMGQASLQVPEQTTSKSKKPVSLALAEEWENGEVWT